MGLLKSVKKRIAKFKAKRQNALMKNQLDSQINAFLYSQHIGVALESAIASIWGRNLLIVSLTSYPLRIPTLHYTLYSLLTQTLKPHKLILWLSKEEFPNKEQDLPSSVLDFTNHGLEIKWCEKNIKSYKKLIPTLQDYLNAIIVTCDDDVIYPKDWLSKLYNAYVENPQYIHCHRAHRISFDESGSLLPYRQWESCISHIQTSPSFLNFFTGVGGVLYPPHCLYEDVLDEQKFLHLAPHQDDIWFWAMALLKETKINVVEENYTKFMSYVDYTKCGTLWLENAKGGINDKVLHTLLESYPVLRERVRFDSSEYWENRYKSFNVSNNGSLSISGGGYIIVKKRTYINNNFALTALRHKITIGENCFIGVNFQALNADFHGIRIKERSNYDAIKSTDIDIGDDCFIGNNVIILKGVKLGRGCVVAAGSVVTQSFEADSLIAGNPARLVRRIEQ
ncbi:acyltransferase [Helicobacter ganmani]|uniref:acyltransferase n=5 Tax=Helicobacter TaxID=209 RepID=UPI003A847DBE